MSLPVYVAIDIETSGLDYNLHEIVEVAAIKFNSKGNILDTYEKRFKAKITQEAQKIHGISTEDVQDKYKYKDASDDLRRFCGGQEIVGHNIINFDLKFLNFEHVDIPKVHDTYRMARDKWKYGQRNLRMCCKRAKIKVYDDKFHGARYDAEMSMKLFLFLFYELEQEELSLDMSKTKNTSSSFELQKSDKPFKSVENPDHPCIVDGDLYIPFDNKYLTYHWWKDGSVVEEIIGREEKSSINKYGVTHKYMEDIIETTPRYPGVVFKSLDEIYKELS